MALSASAETTELVVYDSIPDTLPANVVSQAFYATRTSEFGQLVDPVVSQGELSSVEVGFSSWACESGSWNLLNCESEPGATFSHPITETLYSVDEGLVGEPIGP